MYIIIFFYFYNMNIKQIDVIQLKKRQTIEEKKKEAFFGYQSLLHKIEYLSTVKAFAGKITLYLKF